MLVTQIASPLQFLTRPVFFFDLPLWLLPLEISTAIMVGSFRSRSLLLLACVAAVSALAPGMRATVRPAVSSRSSVTTMKTYASLKEAQAAIAAEEAAAAAPAKAVKAPREPRAPREAPKPREPRATKAAPPAPPPPPPAPLTAAEQRSAMEAELAAIQASRKAAEAELKAAQEASKSAKAKVGGGGGGSVSLPSVSLPKLSAPSVPKFDLSIPTSSSDASPLTGPGAYGLAAGLALGLVPAGALISARAFLMQRK